MKTSKTPATMTTGMQNLMAALPKDGSPKRVGGGVLLSAKKLAQLGMVTVDGTSVALVLAKRAPKAAKPAKAKAAKPAKKAPKAKPASKAWPAAFPSRAAIRAQLTESRDARVSALQLLADRTRARVPGVVYGEAMGLMSSDLVRGMAMSAKVAEGSKLTADDERWLLGVTK